MPQVSQLEKRMLSAVRAALPKKGARLIVAVSGGLDSMLLLEALRRASLGESRVRVALHFQHGLRGAASLADEQLVRKEAERAGFVPQVEKWSRPEGEKMSQASARAWREARLAAVLTEPGDRVFLAHHADDQAETVLFRLLRGTGLRGLAGMAPVSGKKLRPLLQFTRLELAELARNWGVKWREDASNQDGRYERNWLRNEILPLIERRRPGARARLAALAAEARSELVIPHFVPPPGFAYGPGITFFRQDELARLAPRELQRLFSLSRHHTSTLRDLLRKTSGTCTAEGARFRLSQRIVLVERRAEFTATLERSVAKGGVTLRSPLGEWHGPADSFKPAVQGLKKLWQKERVPVFFRAAIPALSSFQPALKCRAPVRFAPSPLAAWWRPS